MSRSRRVTISISVLLLLVPAMIHADDITTQGWIDGPFFDLLGGSGICMLPTL